ncbi:MAG: hypothetical protein OEU32_05055 [Acidimicrobiia bacterium]|nr:hypothetical protein [Acidimicrobiia bacterium]
MPLSEPIRVALLVPYWTFWESSVGPAFRADREAIAADVAATLTAAGHDVVVRGLVSSPSEGTTMAATAGAGNADVVLVVQSMAVPPTHAVAALDALADVPVVVWALQREPAIPADFGAADITRLGATVGTPMLTNVLARAGRVHQIVVGEGDEVVRVVRAAGLASRLGRVTIARVGTPIAGYDCVDVDDDALREATGIRLVSVGPDEVARRYRAVTEDEVDALRSEVEAGFDVEGPWHDDAARSVRLAAALDALDADLGVDAGAMNCHVPEIRFAADPGVTPCFALGRETGRGVPWTCAGDVSTTVAMIVARSLGGAALYHEIEAIDFETAEVALANSGEHDIGWCPAGQRPRFRPNPWFESDAHTGWGAWFELPAGPASLVAFTPHPDESSGFRLVVAEGEITSRSFPESPTVGGAFRFAGALGVADAWKRWVTAGVNHHSAAAPGHLAADIETVARFLGVGCVRVS